MTGRRCVIIGAGDFEAGDYTQTDGDYIIAADAGYEYLCRIGVEADMVLGDFDSYGSVPKHPNVVLHPVIKDDTDTMLAVKKGFELGFREFMLCGCLGGRLDHTIANLQTLAYIASLGGHGFALGGGVAACALCRGRLEFEAGRRGTISVFALCGEASGVYLSGLKYPLVNAVLNGRMPLGVSNEFTGAQAQITLGSGTLSVLFENGKDDILPTLRGWDESGEKSI